MVYFLPEYPVAFPDPEEAEPDGLLAIGGALTPEWLLTAYSLGIFPWFGPDEPILWWSPDPRAVMKPGQVHISHSMRTVLNQRRFELRVDTAFEQVIRSCATVKRKDETDTWIVPQMLRAYVKLHELGFAHSFEAWQDGQLVGGLYGVSLGKMFFGESMFHTVSNASKFAFIMLAKVLENSGFTLIDCQVPNAHLERMGCSQMPRKAFLELLRENQRFPTLRGIWQVVDGRLKLRD